MKTFHVVAFKDGKESAFTVSAVNAMSAGKQLEMDGFFIVRITGQHHAPPCTSTETATRWPSRRIIKWTAGVALAVLAVCAVGFPLAKKHLQASVLPGTPESNPDPSIATRGYPTAILSSNAIQENKPPNDLVRELLTQTIAELESISIYTLVGTIQSVNEQEVVLYGCAYGTPRAGSEDGRRFEQTIIRVINCPPIKPLRIIRSPGLDDQIIWIPVVGWTVALKNRERWEYTFISKAYLEKRKETINALKEELRNILENNQIITTAEAQEICQNIAARLHNLAKCNVNVPER